ncbi:hypothetical protein KM043_010230 [Ampulex compressa]|nr:hypothetical protein KM043_010230 [Ampulex compressa]
MQSSESLGANFEPSQFSSFLSSSQATLPERTPPIRFSFPQEGRVKEERRKKEVAQPLVIDGHPPKESPLEDRTELMATVPPLAWAVPLEVRVSHFSRQVASFGRPRC